MGYFIKHPNREGGWGDGNFSSQLKKKLNFQGWNQADFSESFSHGISKGVIQFYGFKAWFCPKLPIIKW